MEESEFNHLLRKLAKYGVAHRDELKNYSRLLNALLQKKWVEKVFKKGRVFYAFTSAALPFLEDYRKQRVSQLKVLHQVFPRKKVYAALLNNLRFLDESAPLAEEYRFLSDWQLQEPVVPSQLTLSQARFFEKFNAANP